MNTRLGIHLITTTLLFALTAPQSVATTALANSPASKQTAPPSTDVTGTWQALTSTQYGFSVLMPEQPTQHLLENPPNAPVDLQATLYTARLQQQSNVAECIVFVGRLLSDRDTAFERMRSQLLTEGTDNRLIREQVITLNGFPGKEFEVNISASAGEEAILRARIYLGNQYMYQVMVAGSADLVHSAEADRFFSSFKLLVEDSANR